MSETSNEKASTQQPIVENYGANLLSKITKRSDIALALAVVAILAVLILPMPTWLLDLSLGISIAFSVLIMMTVLFINKPLDFNAFPMILLIATMLRLSLNLASTRLILADGHTGTDAAGQVIQAFFPSIRTWFLLCQLPFENSASVKKIKCSESAIRLKYPAHGIKLGCIIAQVPFRSDIIDIVPYEFFCP